MERSLQSKNRHYSPPWQIPGVFITAAVLAVIQLRWTEQYLPGEPANLVYGGITFCSVLLIYALDHLFDLVKYEQKHSNANKFRTINIIITAVSSVALALLTVFNARVIDFSNFWIPILPAIVYAFSIIRVIPFFRGFKEVIIALCVSVALAFPFVANRMDVFILLAPPAFVVCFMNLLVFGWFEKTKDEMYGFRTIYAGKTDYASLRHITIAFIFCSLLLLAGYFLIGDVVFPFWFIALVYWLMLGLQKYLVGHPVYRWIADIALLIMAW